jgi:chromosome partitioning protein
MSAEGPPPTVKVRNLRSTLAEVLNHAETGQRVLIERYNTPIAALIPIADYTKLLRYDQQTFQPHEKEKRMAHRIVVTNISGGEGKTSITRELAFVLVSRGYKVALFDTDPQASLTKTLGLHDRQGEVALTENPAFQMESTILSVFQQESGEARLNAPIHVLGLDVWPSNDHLYGADPLIAGDLSRLGNLREAVDLIADEYDFILFDTKPGITPLLYASVAAADHLLVPIAGDKGTENLDKIVRLIKSARVYSPQIAVRMFVPNRVRANTNVYKELLELMRSYAEVAPVSSQVRDSVLMMEAARARKPLVNYRPSSDLASDLQKMTQDLLILLGVVHAEVTGEVSVQPGAVQLK